MGFECRRVVDYQRHPDRCFKVRHLVPESPLTQHIPMVPAEDDNGILVQPAVLQRLQELANVVVYVRDRAVVCSASPLDLIRGEFLVPEVADLKQTLGVAILVLLRDCNVWQVNVDALVQVPVLLLDGIWVVGVGEGDGHAEGAGTGALSHMVVEELLAPGICQLGSATPGRLDVLVHDLLVVVQLVAPDAGAGLLDAARVVVPLQPLVRVLPVDGPAVVPRVDVAGQAALVAMQLVADEVHLAGQRGLVAGGAQVVGVRGGAGLDAAGVVVGGDLGGQLAGDHGHAGGGAQRRGAVGLVEDDGAGSEGVEVGGEDLRGRVVDLEQRRGQLVGHDVEDVGLFEAGGGGGGGGCGRPGRGVCGGAREGVDIGGHGVVEWLWLLLWLWMSLSMSRWSALDRMVLVLTVDIYLRRETVYIWYIYGMSRWDPYSISS